MLLRTSSNPLSQALLSDGPKRELITSAAAAAYSTGYKASAAITRRIRHLGSPKLTRSKPVLTKFRRAFSDSDLEDLVVCTSSSSSSDPVTETQPHCYPFAFHLQGFSAEENNNSSPSSMHNMAVGELEEDGGTDVVESGGCGLLDRTVTIGDTIDDLLGSGDLSMGKSGMGSIEEEEGEGEAGADEIEEEGNHDHDHDHDREVVDLSSPMYLAAGLGVDKVGCDLYIPNFERKQDMEKYYKSMIKEFPSHSLLLRNYAELLKEKGDLNRAKDYYQMATMADPRDGEILSQYAKLVWELDGADRGKAQEYFERAVQLSPDDSQVLAAYALFLWNIEGDQDDGPKNCIEITNSGGPSSGGNAFSFEAAPNQPVATTQEEGMTGGGGGGVTAGNGGFNVGGGGGGGSSSLDEYYQKMVQENPSNPMILRNYARFLYQSKGDLEGAEEYYARAILLDQSDGELLSQYANLVWELHGDKEKALFYFHRAAKVDPEDSHVLAAYACFLWTSGCEDDDNEAAETSIQLPCVQFPVSQGILASPTA